jgi:hypothetical protein
VFIEVFRVLASRQRMFGEMQLAEGVGFETRVRAVPMRKLARCGPVLPECVVVPSARHGETVRCCNEAKLSAARHRRASLARISMAHPARAAPTILIIHAALYRAIQTVPCPTRQKQSATGHRKWRAPVTGASHLHRRRDESARARNRPPMARFAGRGLCHLDGIAGRRERRLTCAAIAAVPCAGEGAVYRVVTALAELFSSSGRDALRPGAPAWW